MLSNSKTAPLLAVQSSTFFLYPISPHHCFNKNNETFIFEGFCFVVLSILFTPTHLYSTSQLADHMGRTKGSPIECYQTFINCFILVMLIVEQECILGNAVWEYYFMHEMPVRYRVACKHSQVTSPPNSGFWSCEATLL